MKRTYTIAPLLTGLSLALISTGSFASGTQSMGSPSMKSGWAASKNCAMGQKHPSHAHTHGSMQLPAAVLEQMKLTDAQKLELFNAETATRGLRDSMRETMRASRQVSRTQIEAGEFDPQAMFKAQDEHAAQRQLMRQAVQKQWLGFWDSLNAQQKELVQKHMQSKVQARAYKSDKQPRS
jgi:Spy/CpxP family protein refolding chaperone